MGFRQRSLVVGTVKRGRLLRGIAAALERSGLDVQWAEENAGPERWNGQRFDRILLGAKTAEWTAWAEAQQRRGVHVVPDPAMLTRIRDRWSARALLRNADIAVPDAVAGRADVLLPRVADISARLPVIVKPRFDHGRTLALATTEAALRRHLREKPAADLVVEQVVGGWHTTVHFVGEQLFPFARQPFENETSEVVISRIPSSLSDSVRRFRVTTGLLFGKLDLVGKDGTVVCVDVGAFPKFAHADGADRLIAQTLLAAHC